MKKIVISLGIFVFVYIVYFAVATKCTFHPKWTMDYFNVLAQSLLSGHIDISNPSTTYDLIAYQGKWYAPWGILAALVFIPIQIIKGRFVPPLYVGVGFASLNVVIFYWMLHRIRKDFFLSFNVISQVFVTVFFAFGTMNFYVGTLGSAWHVDQMVSSVFGTLSLFFICKKHRVMNDYLWSVISLVPTFLGHATLTLLSSVPFMLYLYDLSKMNSMRKRMEKFVREIWIFIIPLGFGSLCFFLYNYVRFGSIFEYGYRYIHEAPHLAQLRLTHGVMSFWHVPNNFWHFALNIPGLYWQNGLRMHIDLFGNSLFYLSPPLLTIFLACPFVRTNKKWSIDPYVTVLWIGAIITFLPSIMLYSTGWMQFGYRYALDIVPILVLLTVFGAKGKISWLYVTGIVVSITFHVLGITALL